MAAAEKKPEIVLERTYNVPLRKEWLKVPKYKRAKKAVTALRQFLVKHMNPKKQYYIIFNKNLYLMVL